MSIDEAGEAMGIRRNTVRSHLRSIFSKLGITRQSELLLLVFRSLL
ncbi:LuxR C-terminal-related transcriptional regulator [Paraburkholderia pallida]|nr:LuxR C-terminal-related transcriptional regulator [Paraburkholderia pallida]